MGTIEMLVMGDYVIKRKQADVRALLGEKGKTGMLSTPLFPVRSGAANYKSTFRADEDSMSDPKTLVQIPDRPMHNERDGGWFELVDELEGQLLGMCDGKSGVNDMMSYFAAMAAEDEEFDEKKAKQFTEEDQMLIENILRRLIRLYDSTLISW